MSMTWQTMETAHRDGTKMLLVTDGWDKEVVIGFYDTATKGIHPSSRWRKDDYNPTALTESPTQIFPNLWMDIPPV